MKYVVPPKIEKVMKTNRRLWRNGGKTLTVAIAFLILGIIGKSCWDGYWRTYQWSWQVPVEFRTPLIIKRLQAQKATIPVISAKVAPEGQIEPKLTYSEEFEQAYKTVRLHESSNGRPTGLNGHCIAQGGINEIGFAPHESYCFTSSKDQKDTFMLWLKNRYGIPCVKVGACRATIGDLLMLYSSGAYSE